LFQSFLLPFSVAKAFYLAPFFLESGSEGLSKGVFPKDELQPTKKSMNDHDLQ
jgi:hypothetical protein